MYPEWLPLSLREAVTQLSVFKCRLESKRCAYLIECSWKFCISLIFSDLLGF